MSALHAENGRLEGPGAGGAICLRRRGLRNWPHSRRAGRTRSTTLLTTSYNQNVGSFATKADAMFTFRARSARLCDGLSRRDVLHVGGLGALGLTLPALLGKEAQAAGKTLVRPSGGK